MSAAAQRPGAATPAAAWPTLAVHRAYLTLPALRALPPPLSAGTMTIAMESWISWIVGGLTIANGLFNGYAMCVHPAFRKGGRLHAHADPFKGMSTGEREVAEYLKRNPDMAVRVGATAANVARNNPELAQQAMRGAASSAAAPAPAPAAAAPAPAASSSPFGGSPTAGDDENPFA